MSDLRIIQSPPLLLFPMLSLPCRWQQQPVCFSWEDLQPVKLNQAKTVMFTDLTFTLTKDSLLLIFWYSLAWSWCKQVTQSTQGPWCTFAVIVTSQLEMADLSGFIMGQVYNVVHTQLISAFIFVPHEPRCEQTLALIKSWNFQQLHWNL